MASLPLDVVERTSARSGNARSLAVASCTTYRLLTKR
jgi:hypothetical protein